MRCPRCESDGTRVIDSRDLENGLTIRRRRECEACSYRFTTYERPDVAFRWIEIDSPSFPSGHATSSAVIYHTLAVLLMRPPAV